MRKLETSSEIRTIRFMLALILATAMLPLISCTTAPTSTLTNQPQTIINDKLCLKFLEQLSDVSYEKWIIKFEVRFSANEWKNEVLPGLQQYRKIWKDTCTGQRISNLSKIYKAEVKFKSIFHNTQYVLTNDEYKNSSHKNIPPLKEPIPLPLISSNLKWSHGEAKVGVDLEWDEFKRLVEAYGNSQDRSFVLVKERTIGKSNFPIWENNSTSEQTCKKFGEYNWWAAFELLRKSKKHLASNYLEEIDDIEMLLRASFLSSRQGQICACNSKESFISDLKFIISQMKQDSYYESYLRDLYIIQMSVNDESIRVRSLADHSCILESL